MSIRVSTLVWMMSLALATGCPGGDGDGEGDGNAGASGASGASGSGSGGSGSGTGGSSGNSGLSAEDAASGMCGMGSGMDSDCTGLDEYQACVQSQCMFDACYDGACASYISCLQNAEDPCDASAECPIPMACQDCFVSKASCASNCLNEHVECNGMPVGGGTETGGACDELDTCCASLADAANMAQCTQIAGIIRVGGDMACEGPLMTYCP